MAQQQERCGAAFDLDGLTLRWYTHRGAAHQVGPSLREPECITDFVVLGAASVHYPASASIRNWTRTPA